MLDAKTLVARLRTNELRCRTGVLLIPEPCLGKEAEIAARLGIQYVDFASYILEHAPIGGEFLHLSVSILFTYFDNIANEHSGMDCVLISNTDVAAMRLTSADREQLWTCLLQDFPHRRKAILLGIPGHKEGIIVLQEEIIRSKWEQSHRMATWQFEPRGYPNENS